LRVDFQVQNMPVALFNAVHGIMDLRTVAHLTAMGLHQSFPESLAESGWTYIRESKNRVG